MNNKAIDILKTFTKEDLKKFKDFLRSPFFNRSTKLVKFYNSLIAFHPEYNSKFLNEEKLLKKVNPDLPFNKSTILNLFSDLAKAAEKYFIQLNIQMNETGALDFLRDELFQRRLNKYVEININKAEVMLDETKSIDSDFFITKYRLTNDMINHQMLNKKKSKQSSITRLAVLHADRGRYISYFFVKEMIRGFDNLMVLDKTFMIDKEKNFIFKIFDEIDFEKLLRLLVNDSANDFYSKILEIYLAMFLAFSKPENEKHYYNYKNLLLSNLNCFSQIEIRYHCIKLIRYCMLKSGDEKKSDKYNKELFEIYNFILENDYYKSSLSEFIPVELYRTILLLSLKLSKYKWTFEFIKKYKSKLPPDKRVNMYHYSCAEYYFSRGRYAEAMKSFNNVKLDHFMLKLDVKNLMLMTYYELSLFENALSCLDAYKHFLSKDVTLSVSEKKKNKSFVNAISLLIKQRTSGKSDYKYKILKELKNDLPHKNWIEEKIYEMDMKYNKSA